MRRVENYKWVIVAVVVASLMSMSIVVGVPGIGTFYTNYVPNACYGSKGFGVYVAAANDSVWQNGAVCGKKFRVTCTGPRNPVPHPCTGKSVTVMMIDHCPGCPSTIDLSREAFATIANPVAGIINIDYKPL